jgi:hypothetical protein
MAATRPTELRSIIRITSGLRTKLRPKRSFASSAYYALTA